MLALVVVFRRFAKIPTEGKVKIFSWNHFGRFAVIAIPSILQQSFISVGNIIIQSVINSFGAAVMAGYSAAVKLNTFVVSGDADVSYKDRILRGINWKFNAWGGEYDGLYADWSRDDKIAIEFMKHFGCDYYNAAPFVLEGGSIHTDGEGTLLVTENCLLSKGRNPGLTKPQIEEKLKMYCNVHKIIWLPCGIYNDETNEHVDNVCAFTSPGEVVLAWTDDKNDPQYEMSMSCLKVLENETDAKGRKIKVRKLPIPSNHMCITEYDLKGLEFEDGEDEREAGERLAASYVNFYISNKAVIVPQFGDKNDKAACDILSEAFPERQIIPVYARDIIVGGGNIHCITQQIPKAEGFD